jgi:hypothetical protein
MENLNANQTNPQGGDLSELKRMLSDFQKKQQSKGNVKMDKQELLKKYFVPRNTKETFRPLPPKKGRKHIEEAFFHVVTLNSAGGIKKRGKIVYCPAHNDSKVKKLDSDGNPIMDSSGNPIMIPAPCPLCDRYKKIVAKQDQSIKYIKKDDLSPEQQIIKAKNDEIFKEAGLWQARKFYILKGIDRGVEKDGPKFWRFKHNFKNQGTLDKLLPILEDYMSSQQADFSDPENGTDLNITMAETTLNGKSYKQITAITSRGKSKLHSESLVARGWVDDDLTWRDVFKPKVAPNVNAFEYLEMVLTGTDPYWDDSDIKNKHWVFPGRPDLQEKANTRTRNLDVDEDSNFEYASDVNEIPINRVTINSVTSENVGTYKDDAVDVGEELLKNHTESNNQNIPVETENDSNLSTDGDDLDDDLPF